jgi:GAF domain-containing protein
MPETLSQLALRQLPSLFSTAGRCIVAPDGRDVMAGVVKKWPVPDFPSDSLGSTEAIASPNLGAIFSALSVLIATLPRDPNMILGAIARGAQSMTRSNGAAIAMRRDGVVICLGRSGETAPALGTRLGVDSGISGECLRIGKSLLCDDTSTDSRADGEVCQRFGLRSIAAVPLVQRGETIGILESFSTRPHAFAEEHMDLLMRLAELAEAVATESVPEDANAPGCEPPTQSSESAGLSRLCHAIASSWKSSPLERKQRYRVAAVAMVMLSLLSIVGWVGWRVRHKP